MTDVQYVRRNAYHLANSCVTCSSKTLQRCSVCNEDCCAFCLDSEQHKASHAPA